MKRFGFILVLSLSLLIALFQCSISEEEFSKVKTEQATKTFESITELEIENVTGSIEISNWDKDFVEVTYIKKAKTQRLLEKIEVNFEQRSNLLSVKTELPKKCHRCSVKYLVSIPGSFESIDTKTVTGSVLFNDLKYVGQLRGTSITGSIKGSVSCKDVELDVTTGRIDLELVEISDDGSIDIHVITGGVKLTAPSNFNAEVDFKAVTGSIRTDFSVETVGKIARNRLEGTIGNGAIPCSIQTVTGSIHLIRKN